MSIKTKLKRCGWTDEQVDHNVSCGSWMKPHVRVTVWHVTRKPSANSPGRLWAMGDGKTVEEAWSRCADNIASERFGFSAE